MSKKNMLLTALFAISATQTALPAQFDQRNQNEQPAGWNRLCKAYATSLISGGLIGSITGTLSVQAVARSMEYALLLSKEKTNFEAGICAFGFMIPALILVSEYKLRANLIDDINQGFEENAINHKKNIIRDTAWISSWIAFLSFCTT